MFGRNFKRDLFYLSIMSLLTVLTWLGFDVYRAYHRVEIPQVLKKQIQPLDPQLDTQVLGSLGQRQYKNREELSVSTPETIIPTAIPTSTESASPEE